MYKANPDFIFNAIHGFGGEDGVVQGVLDIFGVPYNSSDVLSSAICFDKSICKRIVESAGVRVVDGFEIETSQINTIRERIEYPFVIKPVANGSSIGLFVIFSDNDWARFQNTPWTFGNGIIVEKYIKGREFTVCVMDGKVLGAIEITFQNKIYDYESKYEQGASSHIPDFDMDKNASKEMYSMAETAFKTCRCEGLVRIDFRYDGENVYFLEINTQPGATECSLVPDIAKFTGLSFEELLQNIIKKRSGK